MPRIFTVEDSVLLKSVGDPQISPDGQTVVFVSGDTYVKSGPNRSKLPQSDLFAISANGSVPTRLTYGPRADSTPRWSPDGRHVAFLSDRAEEGQRQIYLLPSSGGEAIRLTNVKGSIPSPRSLNPLKWFPDGSSIAFQKIDEINDETRTAREAGRDAVEFEQNPVFTRVWRTGITSQDTECISPDGLQIWEYAISPDGNRIAAIVSDLPYEWDWYRCRLAVFKIGEPGVTTLVQTARQVAKPVWSPDSASIAYLTSNWSDRGSDSGDVMIVPAGGGEPRNLTEGSACSFDSLQWPGDSLIATANIDGGSGVAIIPTDGDKVDWLWQSDAWLKSLSTNSDGTAAASISEPDKPSEIFTGSVSDGALDLTLRTSIHTDTDGPRIGAMSPISWNAPDGQEIRGYLILPPEADGSTPLPTVAFIHGGPASAIRGGFDGNLRAHAIATAGFAVYLPNYRGSTGRGLDWTESNIGDMGGADFEDMMAGLDSLIERGISDPNRLGISGWSYGGFTTAWAVTQTGRFKAAVMGAGISDWRSFHGRSYLHTWDITHYGGSDPYDPEGAHNRFSPINYVHNVKTPTLILHGEEDWDVPVEQSYQFHRALTDIGVEAKLVVYPREPHGPTEYEHQLDVGNRMIDWFKAKLL